VYEKVPPVSADGSTRVTGESPTWAATAANVPRTGEDWITVVTFIAKYWPAHVPPSVDHEDPAFEDMKEPNEGAGVTDVLGAVPLHFHPNVPPDDPDTTT
jgi:hypothetical protein